MRREKKGAVMGSNQTGILQASQNLIGEGKDWPIEARQWESMNLKAPFLDKPKGAADATPEN